MHSDRHPTQNILLSLIHEHRFATTRQLMRFTKAQYSTERSALRQTLRHLRTLNEQQLIMSLERRVGGWQGGSQVTVWTLTGRGKSELTGKHKRLLPHRLSTTFLEHQLAVTEARVILKDTAQRNDLHLQVEAEPACWRQYLDQHSIATVLKPDLAVIVTSDEYVDRYFLEVDRATENPARVIRKCWQYERHRRNGSEQEHHGIYPAIVWIVPHEARKHQITRAIQAEPQLPDGLFTVLMLDELPTLIRNGPPSAV